MVLQVSADADGRPRVLTTNFDTLFERAHAGWPSHATKALPKPGGAQDHGVLHLHGRRADEGLRLEATDLVLTSADFGDAYLRDGWASQYIEDRMRIHRIVLLGYKAEDAAFRLLLETLDVDRERFSDLKPVYALEQAEAGSAAIWRAKGIVPIEFASYDAVYATLQEWARYATRPAQYARERVMAVLQKAPDSTSAFEREQLRFFITIDELPSSLLSVNPSLAWLPALAELNLIKFDQQRLGAWIAKKFSDPQAVGEVAAHLHLFGGEVGGTLQVHLNDQARDLPELLVKCWRLLIQVMQDPRRMLMARDWYDVEPRLKKAEVSADLFRRLGALLRPRLRISKRRYWYEQQREPQHPRDLMQIEYKSEEHLTGEQVVAAWPKDAPVAADAKLLGQLTDTLKEALADATEAGVEGEDGLGASDTDIPSIARHKQNAYRSGFQEIARAMADIWERLLVKDAQRALDFLRSWSTMGFRLARRLAAFAAADRAVPAAQASDVLLALPQGEWFVTGACVEVHRLLKARWGEWGEETRRLIEGRICQGPPRDWFNADVDMQKILDRARFDLLGDMDRAGLALGKAAQATLREVRDRHPNWGLRPPEQAGFHSWRESHSGAPGDVAKLAGVADAELVDRALAMDAAEMFGDGNNWYALCRADPSRALRGLQAKALPGARPVAAWERLLWPSGQPMQRDVAQAIAAALLEWPQASLSGVVPSAAAWFEHHIRMLETGVSWQLWDHLASGLTAEQHSPGDSTDVLGAAMNSPAGRLAEILVEGLNGVAGDAAAGEAAEARLDRLMALPGSPGVLARARLAADIAVLDHFLPAWTHQKLVPLFDWSAPDEAKRAWSARSRAGAVGTPRLFALTKAGLLEMLTRPDVSEELRNRYAEWLTVAVLGNQEHRTGYDVTAAEARAVLRRAGAKVLPTVAHRLADEMESVTPDKKMAQWQNVVGPVFVGLWPLDHELQTAASTSKLLQLLLATGAAFPLAAKHIVPFTQVEDTSRYGTVYAISRCDEDVMAAAPAVMLDVVGAVVGSPSRPGIVGLGRLLDRIKEADPNLVETRKYQALLQFA